jgi:hypothetical protein
MCGKDSVGADQEPTMGFVRRGDCRRRVFLFCSFLVSDSGATASKGCPLYDTGSNAGSANRGGQARNSAAQLLDWIYILLVQERVGISV